MIKQIAVLIVSVFFVSLIFSEERTFSHQGLERIYYLYLPENLTISAPLVVVMHGYTSSAKNIMSYSKMNEVADRDRKSVV